LTLVPVSGSFALTLIMELKVLVFDKHGLGDPPRVLMSVSEKPLIPPSLLSSK
jgi:hypothetical protein